MKLTTIFLLFINLLIASKSFAQPKFSEDRTKFMEDLKTVMEYSKNEQAIQIGQKFESIWNSGNISDKQKMQIYNMVVSMQKKRYRVNPNYMGYFDLFNNAVSIKGVKGMKLDSVIYVTSQVLENNPVQLYQKYLDFINTFLGANRFYSTSFNRLNVQASNFSIWYVDPKTVGNEVQVADPPVSSVEKVQDENADWSTSFSEDTKTKGNTDVNMENVLGQETIPTVTLPPLSGPYVRVSGASFTISTKNDSVTFNNIKGSVMAFNNIFVGEKAKFDWSYAGLNANEVFAELNKFSMNVSKTELYAEDVTFTYKGKIEKPIKGSFAFKAVNKVDKTNVPYPAFASYSNKINLGNIGEGLSLTGGFSLSGKIINTTSADMGNSVLTLKNKAGNLKYKAVSKGFEITDSAITSRQAAIIVPFNTDSIYHFGVKFNYLKKKNHLKLTQAGGSFKNASFYDTYHKLEINSEAALYDINKEVFDFYIINGRNQVPVLLSSYEYFEEDKYDKLKGLFPFHPLQLAIAFSRSGKGNSFYSDDMATSNKQNPATVRAAMNILSQEGFAEFNPQTGYVKLTKKAWHYYLAKANKKDFDGIQLSCLSPQKANVSINLNTKKMVANGVKRAFLCRPLNVFIETDSSNVVTIDKNRLITFNGTVNAGRFQFSGKNYKFDYDSFMVRMAQVDVVNINISKDYNIGIYGGENMKHKKLGIELSQSKGELYINKPSNKSGRRSLPEYPIFHASTGGVVYFDKKEILGGVYDRGVAFKIPPFTVDSLNSEQEQAIAFEGIFLSKGIFPDFKEKLTLQQDLSLGFEHTTPKEGYPVYGTKGRYYDKITLNMLGIRGSGKLETMGATVLSEDLIFYPDSLVAIGSSAEVKKQTTAEIHHPDINIEEHEVKWFPKKDTLMFHTFNKLFTLYNKTAEFEGKIGLTPKSAFGDGKLLTNGSEIASPKHVFKEETFTSRNAKFKIKSDNADKPTMVSSNVKIDFDLKNKKSVISPEVAGFASDTFPYIQYSTSINRCEWDLEKQTLTMGNKKDLKTKLGNFYALSKESDSLQFPASFGFYDIKKQYLLVRGVPHIRVVDSEILPDSNKVTIVEGGKIETLKNATIRMDSSSKYHVLREATLDIISKNEFKGEAKLDYKPFEKETHKLKVNEFSFEDIKTETSTSKKKAKALVTKRIIIAKSEIDESQNVHISEGILFKGTLELRSNQKNHIFNGFAKLDLKRNNSMGSWIAYNRAGDSSDVVINLANATTDNGAPISNGLHWSIDGSKIYASFISLKENENDKDILKVAGNLKFNEKSKEYLIADVRKLQNNITEGNSFSFNDNTSSIHYEGKASLVQPVTDFEVQTSLVGKGSLDSSNYSFNSFWVLPAGKINPAALTAMGNNISAYAVQKSSPYSNDYTDVMRLKLVNIIGQKAFEGFEKQVMQGNGKSFVNLGKLSSALVFSQINMIWSNKHSAFYSKGLIGVSNILKKEINSMVEGYVEVKKTGNGEAINILLTPNADYWYFISFQNNRLALTSNDTEFNSAIQAKSKGEGAGKLSVVFADASEKVQFNKDFNQNYLGKEIFDDDAPSQGASPVEPPSENTTPDSPTGEDKTTPDKGKKQKGKKEENFENKQGF